MRVGMRGLETGAMEPPDVEAEVEVEVELEVRGGVARMR